MIAAEYRYSLRYWSTFILMLGLTAWMAYWIYVAIVAKFYSDLPHFIETSTIEFARSIPDWQDVIYLTAAACFVIALILLWRRSWFTAFALATGILLDRIDWIFLTDLGANFLSMATFGVEAVVLVLVFTLINDKTLE